MYSFKTHIQVNKLWQLACTVSDNNDNDDNDNDGDGDGDAIGAGTLGQVHWSWCTSVKLYHDMIKWKNVTK